MKEVTFVYKNYKGEVETRHVIPEAIVYNSAPGYGYEPGWFLVGFDFDRQAKRDFALTNIVRDKEIAKGYFKIPLVD